MKTEQYDVIIIGGSYAGLSAAMALGRSLQKVLIIDGGQPCNRQTPASHNFITHDGETPAAIAQKAKEEVLAYPTVQWLDGFVQQVSGSNLNFMVTTDIETFSAKKILFATGVKDLMPDIAGFAECWGISAIHCPYCHGYEYRDAPTGILINGDMSFDFGKFIQHWTKSLTIFTNGPHGMTGEIYQQITARGIKVIETELTKISHQDGYINAVHLANGDKIKLEALYARLPFDGSKLPQQIGCTITDDGYLAVDEFKATNIPGVFAAGDNTTRMRSVAYAVGAGSVAGAMINHQLIQETE
ncbi:NAD(P)/FAD-dependent oxidoreductase [Mucilaginibacter myungsuensis]|uniref:NAD(P)/FAD-dependent oxidoreductase n=1 Tax=Mucilaginibacter myungsuensis TaxID=649104 RepID=A0A929PXA4_9SPHI|nr:NAD(P)/FAD-dependent oxidoreductase [Mucilaginibacter myungsuensis]MBE9662195.1 NAD(P)/FAD-dependent oxidoreductase [Mucilaginibacter myungsuensis]MDN3599371.1 NAD(P)/FAD-dependent oxidoreductase [Mucilaginibacter myungsuensis]